MIISAKFPHLARGRIRKKQNLQIIVRRCLLEKGVWLWRARRESLGKINLRAENKSMKIKKILLWSIIGMVVLVIIGVLVVALCLDGIVKKGVEVVGPRILQVPLTVDTIHIGVLSGSAKVKNLIVGNPDGYKTPFSVSVGVAEISVDIGSILSDKIVVHSIHVESPEITFEGGFSGNNLSKIMDNLKSPPQTGGTSVTNVPVAQGGAETSKKIEVDDFLITGAKVHVVLTQLGGKEMTVPIPDIHLTDLGKDEAGLTPAELTRQIFQAITTTTITSVTSAAGDLTKGVKNIGQRAVNKIKSGLGGFFK
jgi:hypothetical protein